jgi:hypothetical protein
MPTSRYADVVRDRLLKFICVTLTSGQQIVPGSANTVAIDLIATHIRDQLKQRTLSHRTTLTNLASASGDLSSAEALPSSVIVLEQTAQLKVTFLTRR